MQYDKLHFLKFDQDVLSILMQHLRQTSEKIWQRNSIFTHEKIARQTSGKTKRLYLIVRSN